MALVGHSPEQSSIAETVSYKRCVSMRLMLVIKYNHKVAWIDAVRSVTIMDYMGDMPPTRSLACPLGDFCLRRRASCGIRKM